jgi:hypothetical protein
MDNSMVWHRFDRMVPVPALQASGRGAKKNP